MKDFLKNQLINFALAIPIWGLLQLIAFLILNGCTEESCGNIGVGSLVNIAQVISIYSYADQPGANQLVNTLLPYAFAILLVGSYRNKSSRKLIK